MSDTVIKVENLSKKYIIRHQQAQQYTALRDVIADGVKSIGRCLSGAKQDPSMGSTQEEFWALKDVSFEVKQGDRIGIIGRNGAGKSTLLKILSRITEPTMGEITLKGRVASLLEVGTGFHPELTGRENIFLNGSILGMSKVEIKKNFDEIIEFAEIEKFLDTPVKHYSSGMYVRLAFAVAAHLEPEILVVDEVLAVGDAQFQKKCLGKMKDVSKEGRTILFVSHNMGAIHDLTNICVYLKQGKVFAIDQTRSTVEKYLTDSIERNSDKENSLDYYRRDLSKKSPIYIERIKVNDSPKSLPSVSIGEGFCVYIEMQAKEDIHGANLTIAIKNIEGDKVATLFSWDQNIFLSCSKGKYCIEVRIQDFPLSPGKYFADIGVNQSTSTKAFDVIVDFPFFEVVNNGQVIQWLERPWGIIHWNNVEWRVLNNVILNS
jgi:lipopolysaccharide transport system ATP-binding protein